MQAKIKAAVLTTALVLLTIYVVRKLPMGAGVVDKALNG